MINDDFTVLDIYQQKLNKVMDSYMILVESKSHFNFVFFKLFNYLGQVYF